MAHVPIGQAITAAECGVPPGIIAERLGSSERHVRRILRRYGVEAEPNLLVGTADEHRLWRAYRDQGLTYGAIAYRFCVTPQAVQQRLRHEELLPVAHHHASPVRTYTSPAP